MQNNNLTFIGAGLSANDAYSEPERQCWESISRQIVAKFPNEKNLLISLTWFGPQFDNEGWQDLLELEAAGKVFDNLFLLATVDPPCLNVVEQQEIKNKIQSLRVFHLGNFDGPYQFNFFAPVLAKNFKKYSDSDIILKQIKYTFINYNRKPKLHRVAFVKQLIEHNLLEHGIVTLDKNETNDIYLSIGEKQQDYIGTTDSTEYSIPMDYYSLHRLDLWQKSFLYINAATEFNPVDDLFCQQDTFKPMLGLRPFVINGVQKTYRWLRVNGFKTFNHYWNHIPIETGNVHETLIDLIQHLKSQSTGELLSMYNDMLPDLVYNKERFFEFSAEQQHKMEHLFE